MLLSRNEVRGYCRWAALEVALLSCRNQLSLVSAHPQRKWIARDEIQGRDCEINGNRIGSPVHDGLTGFHKLNQTDDEGNGGVFDQRDVLPDQWWENDPPCLGEYDESEDLHLGQAEGTSRLAVADGDSLDS